MKAAFGIAAAAASVSLEHNIQTRCATIKFGLCLPFESI